MCTDYVYDATVQFNRFIYTGCTQNYLLKIYKFNAFFVFFVLFLYRTEIYWQQVSTETNTTD